MIANSYTGGLLRAGARPFPSLPARDMAAFWIEHYTARRNGSSRRESLRDASSRQTALCECGWSVAEFMAKVWPQMKGPHMEPPPSSAPATPGGTIRDSSPGYERGLAIPKPTRMYAPFSITLPGRSFTALLATTQVHFSVLHVPEVVLSSNMQFIGVYVSCCRLERVPGIPSPHIHFMSCSKNPYIKRHKTNVEIKTP